MGVNKQNFDDDRLSPAFRKDLGSLYRPPGVPAERDQAILGLARRHSRRSGLPKLVRWSARAAAVLAAGVGIYLLAQQLTPKPPAAPSSPQESLPGFAILPTLPARPEDVDGNGQVNILDAFALARRLEQAQVLEPQWDMNHDGRVDRRDVDNVAYAAVKLPAGG